MPTLLDGSSIVDNNWAVGTMIGVWSKESGSGENGLIGATGRDQVTALIALYGPRTTVLVGLDDGVYEFSYGCTPEVGLCASWNPIMQLTHSLTPCDASRRARTQQASAPPGFNP